MVQKNRLFVVIANMCGLNFPVAWKTILHILKFLGLVSDEGGLPYSDLLHRNVGLHNRIFLISIVILLNNMLCIADCLHKPADMLSSKRTLQRRTSESLERACFFLPEIILESLQRMAKIINLRSKISRGIRSMVALGLIR